MKLFEENQKPLVVYNPADVLMKYDMKPGDFVSIVYLADVLQGQSSAPIKTGRMYNINADTDAQLESYIAELPENNIKVLLTEFRNSKKYQDLLNGVGKNKTGKVDLSTEHIIKVSWLNCNWKSAKDLAKFYDKQTKAEWQLRKDYGFEDGFEDPVEAEVDPEAEENWRDKYNGHNIMPRTKAGYNGNVYKDQTIIPGIYASLSNPNDVAIRFAYNANASRKTSEYYYVNSDGTLFELNRAFVTFLTYAYKQVKDETGDAITGEEKEFVTKLRALLKEAPSTAELTMKCDQVLFLKSTARKGDSKIPFVWINTKNILKNYDFIAPNELNKIIAGKVRKLTPEDVNGTIENINVKGKSAADLVSYDANGKATADPAAMRQRLGITEALKQLIEMYNVEKEKKVLYESIMSNIAKKVKKVLNENMLDDIEYDSDARNAAVADMQDEYGDDYIDMSEDEIISLLQEYDTDYVCISDFAIALADSEQMVCEIEIDEDGQLIMLDEEGDGIVGNITPEEWEQIKEAIEDTLG